MRARAQAALTELAPLLSMDEVMMIQRPFYFVTRFPPTNRLYHFDRIAVKVAERRTLLVIYDNRMEIHRNDMM